MAEAALHLSFAALYTQFSYACRALHGINLNIKERKSFIMQLDNVLKFLIIMKLLDHDNFSEVWQSLKVGI